MTQLHTCAECGHQHWRGPDKGYEECPTCGCIGQCSVCGAPAQIIDEHRGAAFCTACWMLTNPEEDPQ